MAFELYAHVIEPAFSTDETGAPKFKHPASRYRRVLVGTYATKLLAQWWGINMQRVYFDEAKTKLATQQSIMLYEIVEV